MSLLTLFMHYTIYYACSKLEISVTEHLVEVVDKLSATAVVFFRSERILKSQAGTYLLPGEGGILSQAGSQASQASQAVTSQPSTHLPSGEGSNLAAQATQSGRQAGRCSPPLGKEAVYLRQAVRLPRQLLPSQAGTHLPSGEGCSLSQAGSQASQASQAVTSQPGAHLPSGEGSNSTASQASQTGALLPPGEGSRLAASPASQAGTHLPHVGENSSQAGNNPPISQEGSQVTRSGRQNPRCSARQRDLQASQDNSTVSQAGRAGTWDVTPNLPNRLPQGSSPEDPSPKWIINLSSKPLTPAQRSVLLKDPTLWYPLSNLLT